MGGPRVEDSEAHPAPLRRREPLRNDDGGAAPDPIPLLQIPLL